MQDKNLSPDERARAERVRALAAAGDVAALVGCLTEPSWAVRRIVVSSLADIGQPAVDALAELIATQRGDEARLAAAVDALALTRASPDAALLALSEHQEPAVICDALQIFGRRRSVASVERVARLAVHPDDNVGLAAIEALGRIGGEAVVDPLVEAVRVGDFFRRFPAIDALGRSGDARAVPALVALLGDPRYAVDAARGLGRSGDVGAVPPLARLLAKSNDAPARAAAAAIVEIDDRVRAIAGEGVRADFIAAIDAPPVVARRLLSLLARADAGEKGALTRLVGWLGGEGAVEALVEMVRTEPAAAAAAGEALRSLGAPAEAALAQALADPRNEGDVRAKLLPLIGGRRIARDAALACLADDSAAVRVLACNALASMGDASIVDRLFPVLADPDDLVAHAAIAAIQALGGAETERLALAAARAESPRVRRAAIRIIAYFGYPSALEALLEAARGEDGRVRDAAIAGLPFLEDPRALEEMFALAAHHSAGTRAAAARALGRVAASPAVVARLGALLADQDAWVRYYACQAIARLGDVSFVDAIGALVGDSAGQVRIVAIEALARLRGDAAFDVLAAAARSADADMRRAALIALAHVATAASLGVLREATGDADAATRLVALSAIAEHHAADVVDVLAAATDDPDASVRRAAISLLAARHDAGADARLIARLGVPGDREAVIAALAQPAPRRAATLGDALATAGPDAAPALAAVLVRARRPEAVAALEHALRSGDVHGRRAAASALVATRTAAARAILVDVAKRDPDPAVRSIAASSLEPL